MRRERGPEGGLDLCLIIACEGTARLGVRPVHRSKDLGPVIDATIDAKLGAAAARKPERQFCAARSRHDGEEVPCAWKAFEGVLAAITEVNA